MTHAIDPPFRFGKAGFSFPVSDAPRISRRRGFFYGGVRMNLYDRLEAAWLAEGVRRRTYPGPTFTARGLELGKGTLLVGYREEAGGRRSLDMAGQEDRILALLSVAWNCAMPDQVLRHVAGASRSLAKGDVTEAYIHLALGGLGPVALDRDRARLLFLAEGLLDAGHTGDEICRAWGLGARRLEKFNPNHYPASDDRAGQFAPKGEGGGVADSPVQSKNISGSTPKKDPTTEKKEKFVSKFYSYAKEIAAELDVPVENILGLCALESGWGGVDKESRFAREGNNFFSQHAPAPFSNGTMQNEDDKVKVSTFATIGDSFRSFVTQYGRHVKGIHDPATFAAALQDAGKYGINATTGAKEKGFVPGVVSTIRHLRPVIDRLFPPH